jgi:hypothetical protein
MNLPKDYKDRLVSITDSINHAATSGRGHLPSKISCLLTNVELLKLEIKKLKKLKEL